MNQGLPTNVDNLFISGVQQSCEKGMYFLESLDLFTGEPGTSGLQGTSTFLIPQLLRNPPLLICLRTHSLMRFSPDFLTSV